MYQAIRQFKQLQQISLRQANELGFDTFAEIASFLIQGINGKSAALRLYNENSQTGYSLTHAARQEYEQRFYELLQRDLRTEADFSLLIEREQCILDMCRRFDPSKYEKVRSDALRQERASRAYADYESYQIVVSGEQSRKRPESKFSAQIEAYSQRTPEGDEMGQRKREESRIQDQTEQLAKLMAQRLPEILRKTISRVDGPGGQQLLYCSAEELLELHIQLYQTETRLAKQNAHIKYFQEKYERFHGQASEIRRVSSAIYQLLSESGDFPPEARKALLAASNSIQAVDKAVSSILDTKVDVVAIRNLWKGFEASRDKDRLFRRSMLSDSARLIRKSASLLQELKQLYNCPAALTEQIIDFRRELSCFLFQGMGAYTGNEAEAASAPTDAEQLAALLCE